jgi:hypothetical protein
MAVLDCGLPQEGCGEPGRLRSGSAEAVERELPSHAVLRWHRGETVDGDELKGAMQGRPIIYPESGEHERAARVGRDDERLPRSAQAGGTDRYDRLLDLVPKVLVRVVVRSMLGLKYKAPSAPRCTLPEIPLN